MTEEQNNPSLQDEDLIEPLAVSTPTEAAQLALALGLEFRASLAEIDPPRDLVHGEFTRVFGSWGKQYQAVPIGRTESVVEVAVSDPLNTEAIDTLRFCYDCPIKVVVAPTEEIIKAINGVRTTLMSDRSSSLEPTEKERESDISDSLKIDVTDAEDEDAPIIRYVNTLIFRAASQRASDIHIEPFENALKVRFRVDGVLHDVDQEDKYFQAAI
jgi:general secretion pathway protein E